MAINTISAQSYNCGVGLEQHTPITTNGTTGINFERAYKWTAPIDYPMLPKKLRLNFWAVTKDDGTGGFQLLDYSLATKSMESLNKTYAPFNICFELNGIGTLKDSISVHGKSYWYLKERGILKGAYNDNAINVYVTDSIRGWVDGETNYGSNSVVLRGIVMTNPSYRVVLAHEIAHSLGVMHTIGNRNNIENFPNGMGIQPFCERVTRDPNDPYYNADTAGDRVRDTAADPGLIENPTHPYHNTTNCVYIGSQINCDGTPYQVDSALVNNIMSYGGLLCKTIFSTGQAERMHYLLTDGVDTPIYRALIQPNDFTYDLTVRDGEDDFGVEPNTVTQNFWTSPDIWIRTSNDNNLSHENPIYGIGNNYIKVRVVNKGCSISDGEGKLKLYWTKAGTNLPMDVWEGGNYNVNGYPLGGLIGEIDLPALESYEEHIFTFPWSVPNPANYSTINEPWHYCLMAKIESPNDVSTLPEHNGFYYHFLNSNNIALKNVHVINNTSSNSGKIHIGNFEENIKNYRIKLSRDIYHFPNTNIFEEAEIKFTFDNKLWNIWQNSGSQGTNFSEFGEKTIIVHEDTEIFLNNFPANDFGLLNVKVNFLTEEYTSNNEFGFNVEHWDNNSNELMGGELYLVNKNERDLFTADATIANNTLNAVSINEPAVYNWYDANGNLLHTGQNYTVNNANGTYLLEVIADYDGYKDMKEVTITPNNTVLLHNIYPNPTTSNVTVQYNQLNCNNAYLMLINVNSNASANYILNLNNTNININTSQYAPGLYRVVLVCDNNVTESHNLIIQ